MLTRTHAALAATLLGAGLLLAPGAASGQPLAPPRCADFTSATVAQAALRADPTDPGDLDTERTGVACAGWDYTVKPPVGPPTTLGAESPSAAAAPTGESTAARTLAGDDPSVQSLADAAASAQEADPLPGDVTETDPTKESVLAQINVLECTDYTTQVDAIVAASTAPTLDDAARGTIQEALNTKATELNFCVDVTDVVVPTEDDGSTAVIGGEQVTEIPDGSAETGRG